MAASRAARASAPSIRSVGNNSRKRRRSESPKGPREPIVFQSPGLKPDVRLIVCGQEFHVHSVILKIHSNFFRKFLDSPDKEASPASFPFKYDYVSVIDADGFSGLEPVATAKAPSTFENSLAENPKAPAREIEPFHKLLCSMYTRPYVIKDVVELLAITDLADYYCSLPNLSGTLSTALIDSPMFKWDEKSHRYDGCEPSEFVQRASEVIFAAKKLRHPVLFRECFIHLVAKLHDDEAYPIWLPALRQDMDLWPLLNAGKSNLRKKILRAQHAILLASVSGLELGSQVEELTVNSHEDPEDCASFYKRIFDCREQMMRHYYDDVDKALAPVAKLLQSNLVLDRTGFGSGEGPYEDVFLCAELEDEDMPWDDAEFDW